MTRTVIFTRETSESCVIEVEVPDFATDMEKTIADLAIEKLRDKDPGWIPADRCWDVWDEYTIEDEED